MNIPPVVPYGRNETWWPLILALAFIGLVALTAAGMARAWGMGTASADPNITIAVYAPNQGVQHVTIDYGCGFETSTGSLLPELAQATQNVLKDMGGWYGIAVARRGLCKQIQLVKSGISQRTDSKHLIGAAVDFYCYDKETKKAIYDCDWERLGRSCRQQGLIWGGDFPTPDPMHCELPPLQPLQ
jgi:hypothetical protein